MTGPRVPSRYRYEMGVAPGRRRAVAGQISWDITPLVLRAGPVEERVEEVPGVPAVPTVTLVCWPEGPVAPAGPVATGAPENVWLKVHDRAALGGGIIFAGVLAARPAYEEDLFGRAVTLRFAGELAAWWDDEPVAFASPGEEFHFGHVADDLIPGLLKMARRVPAAVELRPPALTARTPFWSYYGRPTKAAGGKAAAAEVRALAWDAKRKVLYVGAGPYVRSFDPATRRWRTVARVKYVGVDPGVRAVGWRVGYLEYDAEGDVLRGVAETAVVDITDRRAHLRATFAVPLGQ